MARTYAEQSVTLGVAEVQYDKGWYWTGNGICMLPGVVEADIPVGGTGHSVLNTKDDTSYIQIWQFNATAGTVEDNVIMTIFEPFDLPEGALITSTTINYRARTMQTLDPPSPWVPQAGMTYAPSPVHSAELVQFIDGNETKKWITLAEHHAQGEDYSVGWIGSMIEDNSRFAWADYSVTNLAPQEEYFDRIHPNHWVLPYHTTNFGEYFWYDPNFASSRYDCDSDFVGGLRAGTVGAYWTAYTDFSPYIMEQIEGIDLSFVSLTVRYTVDPTILVPFGDKKMVSTGPTPTTDPMTAGVHACKVRDNIIYFSWADYSSGGWQTYGMLASVDPDSLDVTVGSKVLIQQAFSGDPMQPFMIHNDIIVQPMRPSNSNVDPMAAYLKLNAGATAFTILEKVVEPILKPAVGGAGDMANNRGFVLDDIKTMWFTTDGSTVNDSVITNTSLGTAHLWDYSLPRGYEWFDNSTTLVTGDGLVWSVDWTAKTITYVRTLTRMNADSYDHGGLLRGVTPNTVDLWYLDVDEYYWLSRNVPIDGSLVVTPTRVAPTQSSRLNNWNFSRGDYMVRGSTQKYLFVWIDWSDSGPNLSAKFPYQATQRRAADIDDNGIHATSNYRTNSMVQVSPDIAMLVVPADYGTPSTTYLTVESLPLSEFTFDNIIYPSGGGHPDGPLWWVP